MNASDLLVETIRAWGVDVVFGLPGDGINGVMEALRKTKDKIRFIQVRHEESAAFMACAYAKHTGRLGCCVATSGPGGIHLLNGLYDAKLDGQPVLAITGMQFHDLTQTHTQQDVELDKLFANVCVYNARCMGAAHVENITELACRAALGYRGVAHISIPVDFQELEVKGKGNGRTPRNVANHVSDTPAFWRKSRLRTRMFSEAADVLNAGKRIAILAGRGARCRPPRRWNRPRNVWQLRLLMPCWEKLRFPTTARTRQGRSVCLEPSLPRKRWKIATRS